DMGVTVQLGKSTAKASGNDKLKNVQVVIGSSFKDTLSAADAGSTLIGGTGTATLKGLAGSDTLVAARGGSTMTGAAGNDTFVYSVGDHKLTIGDFGANGDHDVLQVWGFTQAKAIKSSHGDTVITFADGGSIKLKGVDPGSLNGTNLLFNAQPWQGPAVPP